MNILVIAPHPDDEVLGLGGTIKKSSENGDSVHLCIVTKAYTPDWSREFIRARQKEIEAANAILGTSKTHLLDFPTAKLDTVPQKELNDALAKVVLEVRPDTAYIPHRGDLNRDHRLVYESALVAMRPIGGSSVQKILSYEVLSETEWGASLGLFIPQVYQDVSETIEAKKQAMAEYASEIKDPPHPRSLEIIEALAKKRGSEAGFAFAEAFMLIRELVP